MAVTVKKKIWYGTLFLFLLLILTGVSSLYYLGRLKNDSKKVLQDNYESLAYCHSMQQSLNNIEAGIEQSRDSFEINLQKQEENVTEPGEQNVTSSLRSFFNNIKRLWRYSKTKFQVSRNTVAANITAQHECYS